MNSDQLIIEVIKRKYLLIIATVIVFVLAFVFQYRVLQTFKSSSTFIVNETNVTDLNGPSQFIGDFINSNEASVNRLFKLAYSSEMMNYLIKKFKLYTYYQIDTTKAFAYEKLVTTIRSRIILRKLDFKIIEVTVSDKDRYQAAAIANEIVSMLNILNENYLKKQLQRKIMLYESIYLDVKDDIDQHENKMLKYAEDYNSILHSLEKSKVNIELLRYSLIEMNGNLKNKREELIRLKQPYSVMLETLSKEHLETITVINFALPDYHSNRDSILIISIIFALVSACAMILLINAYLTNQKYLQLIFKKPN